MSSIAELIFTAGVSLVSMYGGMAAAGAAQDREGLRKQRGIAKALLEDLSRIDSEVQRLRDEGIRPWTGKPPAAVPTIHPWIEGLIAQIADAAPDVVRGFMRLERSLSTLREAVHSFGGKSDSLSGIRKAFDQSERKRADDFERGTYHPTSGGFMPWPDGVTLTELPEDLPSLLDLARQVNSSDMSESASLKLQWLEALGATERAAVEYRDRFAEVRSSVFALEVSLIPIAGRRVPTLPQLTLSTIAPVTEDEAVRRLEDEQLLREHGISGVMPR